MHTHPATVTHVITCDNSPPVDLRATEIRHYANSKQMWTHMLTPFTSHGRKCAQTCCRPWDEAPPKTRQRKCCVSIFSRRMMLRRSSAQDAWSTVSKSRCCGLWSTLALKPIYISTCRKCPVLTPPDLVCWSSYKAGLRKHSVI